MESLEFFLSWILYSENQIDFFEHVSCHDEQDVIGQSIDVYYYLLIAIW